jgi:acetolactate synthase-1/2/3 large subunit
MGFGLPSAVGAKVAAPNKMVIDIDGDASFSMTAMELATASQFNIGVKVMVLNNEFQGMVVQWQGMYISHVRICLLIRCRQTYSMIIGIRTRA